MPTYGLKIVELAWEHAVGPLDLDTAPTVLILADTDSQAIEMAKQRTPGIKPGSWLLLFDPEFKKIWEYSHR
jgi:hypothetical protein